VKNAAADAKVHSRMTQRLKTFVFVSVAVGVFALVKESRSAAEQAQTRPASSMPASMPSNVLEPQTDATTQPSEHPADIREGTILDLIGQVVYSNKRQAMFRFKPPGGGEIQVLPLLPSQTLERMEAALQSAGSDTWFRISAIATVYQNHNYLRVRQAAVLLEKP